MKELRHRGPPDCHLTEVASMELPEVSNSIGVVLAPPIVGAERYLARL